MKRVIESVTRVTRSKKAKLLPGLVSKRVPKFWVSATEVRNYIIRDPLVDWLKYRDSDFSRKSVKMSPNFPKLFQNSCESQNSQNFLKKRGNDFETSIVEYFRNSGIDVVTVSNVINKEACERVIELMNKGVPIIHSAPFQNSKQKTQGIIDLLVRSDQLHLLVNSPPLPNTPLCYIVIDIKFSTLPLRADGLHLLNSDNYPAYKAQLWIYTQAIGNIQGYTPRYAYILGRRWSCKNEKNLSALDKLGVIDFEGVDREIVTRTAEAVKWVREVKTYGKDWTALPPSRKELFPNMCKDSGSRWNGEKKKLAEELGDITQLWYCGERNRNIALQNGISTWRDPRCSSATIGFNGSRASILDEIIDINRHPTDLIRPEKIKTNLFGWRKKEENQRFSGKRLEAVSEFFVDFETIGDVFADFKNLPEQPRTDMIFMIGVYDVENGYKSFIASENTREAEFQIMGEFVDYVHSLAIPSRSVKRNNLVPRSSAYRSSVPKLSPNNLVPRLWYWSAEADLWIKAIERHFYRLTSKQVKEWDSFDWADLCQLFKYEPIVLKGCFKFGLKEIAKAMLKHGFISKSLDTEVRTGMDASVKAWKWYTENRDESIMKDIERYNRYDVEVLEEILRFLRENL